MAIIKTAKTIDGAKRAVVLDLGDLRAEAAKLEREAGERARTIIKRAHQERERLLEEQRTEGREEGLQEGRSRGLEEGRAEGREQSLAEGREQIDGLLKAWGDALDQFETRRTELVESAKLDLLELALEIARKIIHRSIETDPSIVMDQLEAAIEHVLAPSRLIIEVHPDDEALVASIVPRLAERLGECQEVSVQASATGVRGSVRLLTGRGEVDARISTQLDRLTEVLIPQANDRSIERGPSE